MKVDNSGFVKSWNSAFIGEVFVIVNLMGFDSKTLTFPKSILLFSALKRPS